MFIRLDNVKAQSQGLFNIDNHGLYYFPVGSAWIRAGICPGCRGGANFNSHPPTFTSWLYGTLPCVAVFTAPCKLASCCCVVSRTTFGGLFVATIFAYSAKCSVALPCTQTLCPFGDDISKDLGGAVIYDFDRLLENAADSYSSSAESAVPTHRALRGALQRGVASNFFQAQRVCGSTSALRSERGGLRDAERVFDALNSYEPTASWGLVAGTGKSARRTLMDEVRFNVLRGVDSGVFGQQAVASNHLIHFIISE